MFPPGAWATPVQGAEVTEPPWMSWWMFTREKLAGLGTDLLLGLSILMSVCSAALLERVTRYLSGAGRAARLPVTNARAGQSLRPLP